MIIAAWRDGTRRQYSTYIKQWKRFCEDSHLNYFKADVLEYLSVLFFDKRLSYSTINTACSALSSYLVLGLGHQTIGTHPLVSTFKKGVFNMNPPRPRYNEVWNVKVVLTLLRNLASAASLTLEQLTHNLVMLMALISVQRAQPLHELRLDNSAVTDKKVVFYVADLIKQSRPGTVGYKLDMAAYPPDRRLCVVTYMKNYIEVTKNLRDGEKAFFISYKKPHTSVGADYFKIDKVYTVGSGSEY